jgi:hypothetical protein
VIHKPIDYCPGSVHRLIWISHRIFWGFGKTVTVKTVLALLIGQIEGFAQVHRRISWPLDHNPAKRPGVKILGRDPPPSVAAEPCQPLAESCHWITAHVPAGNDGACSSM